MKKTCFKNYVVCKWCASGVQWCASGVHASVWALGLVVCKWCAIVVCKWCAVVVGMIEFSVVLNFERYPYVRYGTVQSCMTKN